MASTISKVWGREVLDSRGNPTVEVEVSLNDGSTGRAIVPSGASTGEHEALELRDGDKSRFLGKGVLKAVKNVNEILSKAVINKKLSHVSQLDTLLIEADGTGQKSSLGANAILGVSLAFSHAVAASQKRPLYRLINEWMGKKPEDMRLPIPLMNVINGGEHANNDLEFQEFMLVPHGFNNFKDALRAGTEIFHTLKKSLDSKGHSTAVGDEGGFAPNLRSNDEALELLCESIRKAGYDLSKEVSIALDVASSSFYNKLEKAYRIRYRNQEHATNDELIAYYDDLVEKFPIVSIEDGLDENDWEGWQNLTAALGDRIQLVGDDLFVTKKEYLQKGIDLSAANAVLIKVNQVGSLSETFDTMALAELNNYQCVTSHRSGETEDVTISHLAVGSGCGQIKTGSLSRAERTAKYNELLRIEERAQQKGETIGYATRF